jgi:hypothetical protein
MFQKIIDYLNFIINNKLTKLSIRRFKKNYYLNKNDKYLALLSLSYLFPYTNLPP